MNNHFSWLRTLAYLLFFLIFGWIVPSDPIDPWGLFSPKKVVYLIFALAFIQALGAVLIRLLGIRAGTIISGFFSGLISSTALTAFLSRKSKKLHGGDANTESLAFLAGTLAMLTEAFFIILVGSHTFHIQTLILFSGPFLVTILMMAMLSRRPHESKMDFEENIQLNLLSILRLTAFIVAILALSKLLQNLFGQSGILILTFLVSLFEIHGSFIANVQLHEAEVVSLKLLGGLISLSMAASYISKLFLVLTLGSPRFKKVVKNRTSIILFSLIISGVAFQFSV